MIRRIGTGTVVVLLGVLGFQNLFARPSYEFALAAGVICPSAAAVITSLELSTKRLGAPAMMARGLENGLVVALAAFAVALLHGLFGGFCDLWRGTVLFALGPGLGTVLGGVWGAVASEATRGRQRRRLVAVLAGFAGPVGSMVLQLMWFYSTPAIFAFEPFVGYVSGALWDTTLHEGALRTYRCASVATLSAVYVVALHLERDAGGRLRWCRLGRPGLIALGMCAAAGSAASVLWGDVLGHWQTGASIAKTLGGQIDGDRCLVIYDRRLEREQVARFARDCEAQVVSIEDWLGTPAEEKLQRPVRVFLFNSVGQKRKLMGAGRTSVAKPWRREIYLQSSGYPHPVLRHELVHVLAGVHGRGPFSIAGALGGWLPNPGLIEGIAEAASPRDNNLSGHQWAAAMRQIDVLPKLSSVMSLSFFANHSSTSYLAAGSFVSHLHESKGAEVVRRWYAGEDLTVLAGASWEQLEKQWWARLDAISLQEPALNEAKARFDRPSLFLRSCPHIVDERLGFANDRVGSGDLDGAQRAFHEVIRLDQGNWRAKLGLARCHERRGAVTEALALLGVLADDENMTQAIRLRAVEIIGDLHLRDGHVAQARAHYQRVHSGATSEGRLRTLELKSHYADADVARGALVALLIGRDATGPQHEEALDQIGRWRSVRPDDGTPDYLFARQHFNNQRWDSAAERLDDAIAKTLPVARVAVELWRMRIVTGCARNEPEGAIRSYLKAYGEHPLTSRNRYGWYSELVERCLR